MTQPAQTSESDERPIWKRFPVSSGIFWFTRRLEDRDISQIFGVERTWINDDPPFLRYCNPVSVGFDVLKAGDKIESDDGWWLKIRDDRMTAGVER